MKNLQDILKHEILDLYSAETQLVDALPKMAKAARHPELRMAFERHLDETMLQLARLKEVASLLGIDTDEGEQCMGMEGLIKEGEKMINEDAEEEVRDASLIGAAQRVEHYEIAGYGTDSLLGICWYPVLDRPDWDDMGNWHQSGLWDGAYSKEYQLRNLNLPLAMVLLSVQDELCKV